MVLGTGTTILDVCPGIYMSHILPKHQILTSSPPNSVSIGARTMLGPNVQIYAATHPLLPEARRGTQGREYAKPIKIGADCWIGGATVICPGVTIGDGVTVGAGSIVTKDVGDRCVVVGNPARVIKVLPPATEEDVAKWT